jgi:hypothetical protein
LWRSRRSQMPDAVEKVNHACHTQPMCCLQVLLQA